MAEILLTAAPYCYGPTAKILCLASELADKHSLTFVGSGPALSLARSANLNVICNENRDDWNLKSRTALENADCMVTALDSRAIKIALQEGIPTVFVDTLMWLRAEPQMFTDMADLYIAQNFFRPHLDNVANRLRNFKLVGPILPKSIESADNYCRESHVLVNFGGLTSPAMEADADVLYIRWILKAIQQTKLRRTRVTVCIPLHLVDMHVAIASSLPNARIISPSMDAFHSLIADCTTLLTVPGLEVVLESLFLERQIIFMPPHNATQALQLIEYRKRGIGFTCNLEADFYAEKICADDLHTLTRIVQQHNKREAASVYATRMLAAQIDQCLQEVIIGQNPGQNRGHLDLLGSNGRIEAARHISRLAEDCKNGCAT